jgi:antirestriction protein ArdC
MKWWFSGGRTSKEHLLKQTNPSSTYDRVTQLILDSLAKGVVPWRKPWKGRDFLPCNAVSKTRYQGINTFLLSIAPYTDHRWLTLHQANELGGYVRHGEKGSLVVFWKLLETSDDDVKRRIPLLRHYFVFNIEQTGGTGLEPVEPYTSSERIAEAETVIRGMPNPPSLREYGVSAYYRPGDDTVVLPPLSFFDSPDHYYATAFHELGHATGHQSRLSRPGVVGSIQFGSEDYSREELIAELSSAFVCAELGLDNTLLENASSYINGWLDVLQNDSKAVISASSHARNASDYILGRIERH